MQGCQFLLLVQLLQPLLLLQAVLLARSTPRLLAFELALGRLLLLVLRAPLPLLQDRLHRVVLDSLFEIVDFLNILPVDLDGRLFFRFLCDFVLELAPDRHLIPGLRPWLLAPVLDQRLLVQGVRSAR